ncbi:hypothetical protein AB1N83_011175 [Pleurotus pulmonarius]
MSPQSVHVRNEEIDRWDHPVDDLCVSLDPVNTQNTDAQKVTCMIGLIPHIVSLAMFVTMKSTCKSVLFSHWDFLTVDLHRSGVDVYRTDYDQGLRELSAINVE